MKELIGQAIDFTKNIASSMNVDGADQVTSQLNTNKEKLVNEAYTEVKKYLDLVPLLNMM